MNTAITGQTANRSNSDDILHRTSTLKSGYTHCLGAVKGYEVGFCKRSAWKIQSKGSRSSAPRSLEENAGSFTASRGIGTIAPFSSPVRIPASIPREAGRTIGELRHD
jgi:hypothetical protein